MDPWVPILGNMTPWRYVVLVADSRQCAIALSSLNPPRVFNDGQPTQCEMRASGHLTALFAEVGVCFCVRLVVRSAPARCWLVDPFLPTTSGGFDPSGSQLSRPRQLLFEDADLPRKRVAAAGGLSRP